MLCNRSLSSGDERRRNQALLMKYSDTVTQLLARELELHSSCVRDLFPSPQSPHIFSLLSRLTVTKYMFLPFAALDGPEGADLCRGRRRGL